MKQLKLDKYTIAFKASALGNLIQRGIYAQVGMIRTVYKYPNGTTTKSIEAVLVRGKELYAVEQHRGLAISTRITDTEMLNTMFSWLSENEVSNGEGFVYDQVIDFGTEDIDREVVESAIAKLPEGDEE
ncbi:hypothetical protein [Proteus mirabilis]|uniref:hypothetical protein n=1 Tax=Proteus mirabilis TaxID=584 RepID=UPI0034D78A25